MVKESRIAVFFEDSELVEGRNFIILRLYFAGDNLRHRLCLNTSLGFFHPLHHVFIIYSCVDVFLFFQTLTRMRLRYELANNTSTSVVLPSERALKYRGQCIGARYGRGACKTARYLGNYLPTESFVFKLRRNFSLVYCPPDHGRSIFTLRPIYLSTCWII